ncbi:MAG: TonB-dependent receptor plug domain-containing protein, partial [Bacteroidales bacterium]|nr:TonB-dependent receptor plug domain-containing protein [Bacteroidales bacterium]
KYITLLLLFPFLFINSVYPQKDTLSVISEKEVSSVPTISITALELANDEESQDISGLLQSSRDIFVSAAGYTFGRARFRIRGLNTENTSVLMNGIPMNNVETGRVYWSIWGGLNDVTRNKEIKTGVSPSQLGFGGICGITNIITRASSYRKGMKLTYSSSNRSYTNRLMYTLSTGMMDNNLAVTFSGSRRWANEGYVKGTFYDAYSFFLSVEKKINNKHSVGLIGFITPNKRGKQSASSQEAFDLAGTNFYNPYWGFQDGEVRNSRISYYENPMFIASHYWNLNKTSTLTSSVYYSFGVGGSTALDWEDANDPRPDYYRNLPSFYDGDGYEEKYSEAIARWSNEAGRQVNWDYFYFANRKNLRTVLDANGIDGNNITGNLAKFRVEERRNDHNNIGFNMLYNNNVNEHLDVSGGINLSWFKGHHFKVLNDLLGGDFIVDVDKYSDDSIAMQNDLRTYNRIVTKGDRFGYDYTLNVDKYEFFGQCEFTYNKVDFYVGISLSKTQFWRTGKIQSGKFPNSSLGDSEKQNYTNYGIKGGLTYKITGRNFITANAAYITRAPFVRNAYVSPRTRDNVINDLKIEKIVSGDISYIFRSPFLKSRITFYYVENTDQIWVRGIFFDDIHTYGNYIMTGVNTKNMGMEIGIEAKATPTLTFTGVASLGQFIYNSNPVASISQDDNAELVLENQTIYFNNRPQGGMPQTAVSLGAKYYSPKYWFAGVSWNYYDDAYLTMYPGRRTVEAVAGLDIDSPIWNETLNQEELPDKFSFDLFIGKSWKIDKYYIAINLSVDNILDNKDIRNNGYEQYRFTTDDVDKFPPKYYYMYGRTYFLNVSFSM